MQERGYNVFSFKLLSRTAGEGGPRPQGLVGEGSRQPAKDQNGMSSSRSLTGVRLRAGVAEARGSSPKPASS
jgi:hypothetical protein